MERPQVLQDLMETLGNDLSKLRELFPKLTSRYGDKIKVESKVEKVEEKKEEKPNVMGKIKERMKK